MASRCDAAKPPASGMVIEAGTPWVVAEGQPEAVQRALKDVEKDWYKVFGRRPVILTKASATLKGPVLYLGMAGSWREQLVKGEFAGAESFMLRLQRDDAGRSALVATGADMRGSIYAAYALDACNTLYAELHKAEYGKWAAWYAGEKLMGLERSRGRVENLLAALKGEPEPVRSPLWDDYHYNSFYQYQERFSENFPLMYPANPQKSRIVDPVQ